MRRIAWRPRPLALAAFQSPHRAVDKLVDHDGLTAQHVERLAREAAGRLGDDAPQIGLADQGVDVDALHEPIDVHTIHDAVDVDAVEQRADIDPPHHRVDVHPLDHAVQIRPVEQAVDVDAVEQRRYVDAGEDVVEVDLVEDGGQVDAADDLVHVQRLDDNLHYALGDTLGERFDWIGHSPSGGAQHLERIHGTNVRPGWSAVIARSGRLPFGRGWCLARARGWGGARWARQPQRSWAGGGGRVVRGARRGGQVVGGVAAVG